MRRHITLTIAVALVAVWSASMVSASAGKTVRLMGTETLKPNISVFSDFRFSPGPTEVGSGETVTWVEETGDLHTVTIVNQADLPTSFDQLFTGCAACNAALAGHNIFGGPPFNPVLDFGAPGLDTPGDSLLIFPRASVSATISAPAGTTLYYLCAIHPWMQGTLVVK